MKAVRPKPTTEGPRKGLPGFGGLVGLVSWLVGLVSWWVGGWVGGLVVLSVWRGPPPPPPSAAEPTDPQGHPKRTRGDRHTQTHTDRPTRPHKAPQKQ